VVAPLWRSIDEEAKDLLKLMLTKDPKARISASDAVKHPWFAKYNISFSTKEEQNEDLIQSLRNLKNFSAENSLQRAVLSYIATQEIEPREEKRLKQLFDSLDINKSGQVTLIDLMEGYTKVYKDKAKAQRVSEQIMKRLDMNNSGSIEYSGRVEVKLEFLMASMELNRAVTDEMLKRAFDFYDEVNTLI
jgi:calcium-dependent protein kinase